MKILKYLAGISFALAMIACSPGKQLKVTVTNPSDFGRETEMVEIPMDKIELSQGQVPIVKNEAGEVVPSQVTYDGKLIFQSGLAANASAVFKIEKGQPVKFEAKTTGKYMPERKDDFIWENDRVAFRIYGPALIPSDGPSNGIDAIYKRTDKLVYESWIRRELGGGASYHRDHGEGLDDYKVGPSLGAGAMAPYVEGKLVRNINYASQEVLENGPLRTTFRLTYPELEINGKSYTESRTLSIDAGSQLTKITQEYGFDRETSVAAGFPLHAGDKTVYHHHGNFIMVEEPATNLTKGVYLGIIMPGGIKSVETDSYEIPRGQKGAGLYEHVLAVTNYKPGKAVTYYTGYGWEKFGYPTAADFENYLGRFAESLENPFKIKYLKY